MHRYGIVLIVLMLLLTLAVPIQAANIHMHYFESADAFLTESQFQLFSFSALEAEKLTIVAYGLEEDVKPTITLFDVEGLTLAEDLNDDEDQVAVVQAEASINGIYTFLVSRLTEDEGLIRVMLFEGDPLFEDLSLLDKIDPFLPSVAYLMGGNEEEPVEIRLSVLKPVGSTEETPEIYASRGTEIEVPPLEERITPVTQIDWVNDNGDIFYTVNVRSFPDPVSTSQKLNAQFSRMKQVVENEIRLQVDVGEGSDDPIEVPRETCTAAAQLNATLLLGPSGQYRPSLTTINPELPVEIVGENGDYYLIVDTENPTGGSWILKSQLTLDFPLDSEECSRVEFFPAPPLTPENSTGAPPPTTGGTGAPPRPPSQPPVQLPPGSN